MRNVLRLCMTLMVFMPYAILGQTSTTIDPTTTAGKHPHPIDPKSPGGPRKTAHGSVSAVDPVAGTITVKNTYYVNDSTKITLEGKVMAVDGIKVGDTASITYTKSGDKLVALKITITSHKNY